MLKLAINKFYGFWLLAALLCLAACDDDKTSSSGRDPNKPHVLKDFYPKTGPISTRVILEGDNFGNDPDQIRVWFNEKRASLVSSVNDRILAITPKMPGEDCVISVVIGKDSLVYKDYFDYIIQTSVSTLTGGEQSDTSPEGTTQLSTAVFAGEGPKQQIYVDDDDNLWVAWKVDGDDYNVYLMNEEADRLRLLRTGGYWLNGLILYYNPYDNIMYEFMSNSGSHEVYYYNKDADYARESLGNMNYGGNDQFDQGLAAFEARRSYSYNPTDNKYYWRSHTGYFGRVHLDSQTGENLSLDLNRTPFAGSNGLTASMLFDPDVPNLMYFSVNDQHCIYSYNIDTDVLEVWAGESGTAGSLDGLRQNARFNKPTGMCFDSEYNIYVCDTDNHTIRKINRETGYVSTVAGQAGVSGYINGGVNVALFNRPWGIAATSEDILYIGDLDNHAIRRLAIE